MNNDYIMPFNWNLLSESNLPNKFQAFSELNFFPKIQFVIHCVLSDMIIKYLLSSIIRLLLSFLPINDDSPSYDSITAENLFIICLMGPILDELIFRLYFHTCLKYLKIAPNLRILIANACYGLCQLSQMGIYLSPLKAISHCVVVILMPTHGKIYELAGFKFACVSHIIHNIVMVTAYIF